MPTRGWDERAKEKEKERKKKKERQNHFSVMTNDRKLLLFLSSPKKKKKNLTQDRKGHTHGTSSYLTSFITKRVVSENSSYSYMCVCVSTVQ